MKKFVLFLALGVLASCQRASDPVTQGKAYFMGYGCNRCHRIGDAGGSGKYGTDLTYIGFRKSKEWLDLWLRDPHAWKKNTPMPNFHLTDQARARLVEYLSTLKGQDFEKTGKPWNEEALKEDPVKRGGVIFERAGCVGCHAKGGKGGYPNNNVVGGEIPSLIKVAEGYSKEELKARIRDGKIPDKENPNKPDPMIVMPKWGEVLEEDELGALVEYLFSLKPKAAPGEEW